MGNEKIDALSISISKKDSKSGKTVNMTVTDTNGNGIFDTNDSIKFSGEASCSLFSTQDFKAVNFDNSIAKDSKATNPDLTADKDGVIKIAKDKDYSLGSVFGSVTVEAKTTTKTSTGTDYNVFTYNSQTQKELEDIGKIYTTMISATQYLNDNGATGASAAAMGLAALMSYKPSTPTTITASTATTVSASTSVSASISFADAEITTSVSKAETPAPKAETSAPKAEAPATEKPTATIPESEAKSVLETRREKTGTSGGVQEVDAISGEAPIARKPETATSKEEAKKVSDIQKTQNEISKLIDDINQSIDTFNCLARKKELVEQMKINLAVEQQNARLTKLVEELAKSNVELSKETKAKLEALKARILNMDTPGNEYKKQQAKAATPAREVPVSTSKPVDPKFIKMAQDSAKASHIQNKETEIIELLTQIGKKAPTATQANRLTTLLQELDKIEDRAQRSKALQAALKKYEES